ncbi:hypothetical protein M501DRAFT_738592 [Patellaria atrata CBS 101060]|uniref:Uncharacterized protein n=1 Tax=Patellaria atrata CBS 101060 TaxID=1346257 RepID=A0A9P4SC22_9PEZI|nr:hypothetical protein M501DRAFT_738592 [Patellaria atrata CBS 101060]
MAMICNARMELISKAPSVGQPEDTATERTGGVLYKSGIPHPMEQPTSPSKLQPSVRYRSPPIQPDVYMRSDTPVQHSQLLGFVVLYCTVLTVVLHSGVLFRMGYVQHAICTVRDMYSTRYVQYGVCTARDMYNTIFIHYEVHSIHGIIWSRAFLLGTL